MYNPSYYPRPSGFQNNKQSMQHGTMGSVMSKASKLKDIRHGQKYEYCPGCGENTAYYIGGGPCDIDCENFRCKFFKEHLKDGEKRYKFGSDEQY